MSLSFSRVVALNSAVICLSVCSIHYVAARYARVKLPLAGDISVCCAVPCCITCWCF